MRDLATVLARMFEAAEVEDEWDAEYNVELMLATPEGKALAALVEADRADKLLARAQELSATLDECGAYRVEAEADAERLAAALRLDASEVVAVGDMEPVDKLDDENGNPNRTVQSDLRRWADRIDDALAAHDARVKP